MLLDVSRYAVVSVLLMLAGRACVRLLGDPPGRDAGATMLLGPAIGLACWVVVLGILVPSGITIRLLSVPLWLVLIAASAYGAWIWWRIDTGDAATRQVWMREKGMFVALTLLLPTIVMLPPFAFGLTDYAASGLQDKFAYVAQAGYLWDFGARPVVPNIAPLFLYGSTLMDTRYISASLLGVLSVLTGRGDPQTSANLLQAIGLCSFTGACLGFGYVRRLPWWALVTYATITVVSGWALNVVWANNYDNLVVLGWFPLFAAVASYERPLTVPDALLCAIVAAASMYAFPELAGIMLGGAAILLTARVWQSRQRMSPALIAIVIVLPLVLCAPYLTTLVPLLRQQFGKAVTVNGVGPGMFEGLANGRLWFAAFWASGAEHLRVTWLTSQNLAATSLYLACAFGIIDLVRRRAFALIAVAVLLWLGVIIFAGGLGVAYPAYKVVLLAYWLTAFLVISGVCWLLAQRIRGRTLLVGLTVCGLLSVPIAALQRVSSELAHPRSSMTAFSAIGNGVATLNGEPLAVFLDDLDAHIWAMHYLRHYPAQFAKLIGYAADPTWKPVMDQAPRWPWKQFRYVLTDTVDQGPLTEQQGWSRVWGTPAFTIWDTRGQGWAIARSFDNPNGRDLVEVPFVWLGGGSTQVDFVASRAGAISVTAGFLPGPSAAPTVSTRRLQVTGPGFSQLLTIDPGVHSFSLPIGEGESRWTLTPLDPVVVARQPNGDIRPLLIGMRNPIVSWTQPGATQ